MNNSSVLYYSLEIIAGTFWELSDRTTVTDVFFVLFVICAVSCILMSLPVSLSSSHSVWVLASRWLCFKLT